MEIKCRIISICLLLNYFVINNVFCKIELQNKIKDEIIVIFDFNKDGNEDCIKYNKKDYILSFYLNKTNLVFKSDFLNQIITEENWQFDPINNIFFESNGNLIVETELTGRDSYFENYIFKWQENKFILSNIEKISINKQDFDVLEIKTIFQVNDILDIMKIKYPIDKNQLVQTSSKYEFKIKNSIDEIYNYIKEKKNIEKPSEQRLSFYLKNFPLDKSSIIKYNDIGFFLEQGGDYKDAISILEQIIYEFPNRTVAYINLGDAYWGIKNFMKAKEAYNTYITFMKKEGKEAKIPTRVQDRVK